MSATSRMTTYRLDTAVLMRVIGPLYVIVGLVWVIVTVVGAGSAALIAMGCVSLALVVCCVFAVVRPPRVLTLSDSGFRVSLVRGAGTTAEDWSEVESVDTRVSAGAPSIVVTLTRGRSTVIPVALLGRRNREARQEIHDRLNDAHGYRQLDAS